MVVGGLRWEVLLAPHEGQAVTPRRGPGTGTQPRSWPRGHRPLPPLRRFRASGVGGEALPGWGLPASPVPIRAAVAGPFGTTRVRPRGLGQGWQDRRLLRLQCCCRDRKRGPCDKHLAHSGDRARIPYIEGFST